MDELIKAELALRGVINKIEKLFIIREVNDSKISELKTYIEYYEQIKEQIETIKKQKNSEA